MPAGNPAGLRSWLSALSGLLYRTPKELEDLVASHRRRERWVLFGVMMALIAIPFAVALGLNARQWLRSRAIAPVNARDWRALYPENPRDDAPCALKASISPGCPADPRVPTLWSSPYHWSEDVDTSHHDRILAHGARPYWIGLSIEPALLETAYQAGANIFVLGQIRADFKIWVDGEQLLEGRWADNEPIALTVPSGWLKRSVPLRIAIRVEPVPDVALSMFSIPDQLEKAPRLGFMTKAAATDWKRLQYFWQTARPLVFLALNSAIAIVFFAFWTVTPEKAEYFFIALYSLTFALLQLRNLDLFFLAFDRRFVTTLSIWLSVFNAGTGMLVGFSFARLRSSIITGTIVACLALCVAGSCLTSHDQQVIAYNWDWTWSMPSVGTLLGAVACLLQAAYLSLCKEGDGLLRLRIRRLYLFAASLIMLSVINRQVYFMVLTPGLVQLILGRSGPFFMILSMGAIALSEYRAEHSLAQDMPVSPFHRMAELPDSIEGVVLTVDLRGSEQMFRMSARLGRAGDLVETCLSHLWMAVTEHGGVVMATEGDGLRAFFTSSDLESPLIQAIRAVDTMARNLKALEQRFQEQGLGSNIPAAGISFRGSIVEGALRPIWQDYGGTKLPGWIETGTRNTLIESTRYLEIERSLDPSAGAGGRVVMTPSSKERLSAAGLSGLWEVEKRSVQGKHGQKYVISVYRVG